MGDVDESRAVLRRVSVAQFIGSTIDGIALSTAVLYFSTQVGIAPQAIGLVLAIAAAAALVLVVPIGILADAIGLTRAAIGLCALVASALVIYALSTALWSYAIGAILFVVTQAGIGVVRQAIVASTVASSERVRARAAMHTLLNAGMGTGTVIGAIVAVLGARGPFLLAFAVGAVAALGCIVVFVRLGDTRSTARRTPIAPDAGEAGGAGEDGGAVGAGGAIAAGDAVASGASESAAAVRRPGLAALRDHRFVGVSALAAVIQLTMPILSVLLPLWITTRTAAPTWAAPVALGLNTVLVLALQTRWAAQIRSDRAAGRSTLVAAGCLLAACILFGAAESAGPGSIEIRALVLLGIGVVGLTFGEIAAGAGTWHLAFSRIPSTTPGQYQAVFGMSGSVARILGPLLALPLVLAAGLTGWIVIGALMASAAVSLTLVAFRREPAAARRSV